LLGLAIYVFGGRWLPPERPRVRDAVTTAEPPMPRGAMQQRVLALFGIFLCVTVFRGAYEQSGNTIALWADVGLDRAAGGFTIPMTWFQALNPLLVIFLTPVFVAMWTQQAGRGREPAPAKKMSIGAFAVALAFLMLAGVDASAAGHAHWLWLALFFLVFTAGELFVLPIGLGLFARLAPARHAATTIAAWYLASFTGNLLAGALGTLWSAMGHAAFFGAMAGVAATAGVLLRLLDPLVARAEAAHGALSDQRS